MGVGEGPEVPGVAERKPSADIRNPERGIDLLQMLQRLARVFATSGAGVAGGKDAGGQREIGEMLRRAPGPRRSSSLMPRRDRLKRCSSVR